MGSGRFFTTDEVNSSANVAVIGTEAEVTALATTATSRVRISVGEELQRAATVRREAVALAVAGDEGDAAPLDLTDDEGVARTPEGGVDLDRLVVVEELVQAGPADDADLGLCGWMVHAQTLSRAGSAS